jgi:hypothetical protein
MVQSLDALAKTIEGRHEGQRISDWSALGESGASGLPYNVNMQKRGHAPLPPDEEVSLDAVVAVAGAILSRESVWTLRANGRPLSLRLIISAF